MAKHIVCGRLLLFTPLFLVIATQTGKTQKKMISEENVNSTNGGSTSGTPNTTSDTIPDPGKRMRENTFLECLLNERLYNSFNTNTTNSASSWTRRVRAHRSWVQGLRLTQKLEHHTGCVNTIEWSRGGDELLSSGDDLEICVWDASSGYKLKVIVCVSLIVFI